MTGYNKLTEELLKQGYTVENHPDYVMVASGYNRKTLDNFKGGFEYYGWYIYEKTFKTPCGLLCKGNFAHTGLSWNGTDYTYENDNPWILCPKGECDCQMREEPFKSEGTGVLCRHCIVHETAEEWQYEKSCEAELHLYDDMIRRKKTSFILEKNNHVCENHMHLDIHTKEWSFNYNPMSCANGFCRAQSSDFTDGGYCPVLNKYLSKEKGNVFYDVKYSGRDYTKDGTLFEGERFEHIIKGKQLFDKSIRMDIARVIANLCKDEIKHRARYNNRDYDSLTMFRAERGEIDFHWEVLNIRAEKKRTRDLEQDLKDIENGITVTHEFDRQKVKKQEKSNKRAEAKEKRIKHVEKLILKSGYDNMDYQDKKKAAKLLDLVDIKKLDKQHKEIVEKEKEAPKQLSLFDYMGG